MLVDLRKQHMARTTVAASMTNSTSRDVFGDSRRISRRNSTLSLRSEASL